MLIDEALDSTVRDCSVSINTYVYLRLQSGGAPIKGVSEVGVLDLCVRSGFCLPVECGAAVTSEWAASAQTPERLSQTMLFPCFLMLQVLCFPAASGQVTQSGENLGHYFPQLFFLCMHLSRRQLTLFPSYSGGVF